MQRVVLRWGGYSVLSRISLLITSLSTQSCPTDEQGVCDPVMWVLMSIVPCI